MAIGILTIRGNKAALEFKTQKGTHLGVPFPKPVWADMANKYAVLISVKEENDCISDVQILTFLEVY